MADSFISNRLLANRLLANRLLANRLMAIGIAAILVAAGARAGAQGLDASTLASFGGTWLADCADSTSASATVFADSVVVAGGGRRLVFRDLQPAYSYFGNVPPDGYVVALLAAAPGGLEMLGVVFADSTGLRLTIDAYPAMPTATSEPLAGLVFHRCGDPPTRIPAPTPPSRTYELHELGASGLLLDPRARSAYFAALGPLGDEPWLTELDGPSPQNALVTIDGTEYLLASACKNHDCAENNVVLLYGAPQGVVFGLVYRDGRSTLIGAPPAAVAAALERLWRKEFRQN